MALLLCLLPLLKWLPSLCVFLPVQTEHMESGKFAAMKRVPIQDDTELDDFMVEIDILAECKHRNIVGLHEAYFYDQALWVSDVICSTEPCVMEFLPDLHRVLCWWGNG